MGQRISISICPTNIEVDGELLDESAYLGEIRAVLKRDFPAAQVTCLQVGYRQGDEWFCLNGVDSEEVRDSVYTVEISNPALYV
jgi:hypothetical protein